MTIDEKIKRIVREVRKLTATTTDKPVSRRNARARVLSALRAVRAHIDAEYPAIVSRERIKRLTPEGRVARLKRQGFVQVNNSIPYALAGVPVRSVTVRNPQAARPGVPNIIVHKRDYVPRWAATIHAAWPTKLHAAAKDRTLRRALLAEHALVHG